MDARDACIEQLELCDVSEVCQCSSVVPPGKGLGTDGAGTQSGNDGKLDHPMCRGVSEACCSV